MRRRSSILGALLVIAVIFILANLNQWQRATASKSSATHDTKADQSKAGLNFIPGPIREDLPAYVFAFGDSYTTYGFESEGDVPSATNLLGNRATKESQPDQPATYTLKWLDFLVNELSPAKTFAFDFARGASTIDDKIVPPHFWGAKAFVEQGREFLATVNNGQHKMHVDWTAANSAFVVWFGINDVGNTAEQEGQEHEMLYRSVVQSYFKVLDTFYKAGARRFVLLTVPPLQRTPMLLGKTPRSRFRVEAATKTFNTILDLEATRWAETNPQTAVQVLDSQPIFHRILNASPEDATCTTPAREACMWVDVFHPSTMLQKGVGVEVERLLRKAGFWTAP